MSEKPTPEEFSNNPLWLKLKVYYEDKLEQKRRENDSDMPAEKRDKLRGRIAEIKDLLALDKPAPVIGADEDNTIV